MIRRFYFNMIEIILAIAIIAIGISSVMVLFTSGLRAGNEAAIMSGVPDVVESILTHVRQTAVAQGTANSWGTVTTLYPALAAGSWTNESGVVVSAFGASLDTNGSTIVTANGGRDLLFRQLVVAEVNAAGTPTRYASTFSAIAEVRSITAPASIVVSNPQKPLETRLVTENGGTAVFPDADNENSQSLCRLVLEVRISYPAEAAPTARDSKIYRVEVFNDKYNRFVL